MEDSSPKLMMLTLAIGAGLLAVFIVWVSKQIANEQTRGQGIAAAVIALCVLVAGLFFMPTRVVVHTPPATVTPGVAAESSISMDGNGVQVHVHSGHPTVGDPSASTASGGIQIREAQFAWGPVAIALLAVGVIAIVVSSKRGLAAALACLGIVAAVLVMYVFAARNASFVAQAPQAATIETAWDESVEYAPNPFGTTQSNVSERSVAVVEETAAKLKAEDDSRKEVTPETKPADDVDAEAESPAVKSSAGKSSAVDKTTPPKVPPPAWINSEPNMEAGVYSTVAVSGPYSTKRECLQRLDNAIDGAVRDFAEDVLRPRMRYAAWNRWKPIEDRLVESRHFEQVQTSVGPMWNLHVLLTIDQADKAYFQQVARNFEVQQAVEEASIGGFFVLGALALLYGGLRYAGRKKPAAPLETATPEA